jgi:putative DNA primase/helicase
MDFLMRFTGRGWDEAVDFLESMVGDARLRNSRKDKTKAERKAEAERIWRNTRLLSAGDPVHKYLLSRCCYVPGLALHTGYDEMRGPMMVGKIQAHDGPGMGIHRTFISSKIPNDKKRMHLGILPPGCAVRLFDLNGSDVIGISEGVETGISASILHDGLPVWAATNNDRMEKWIPPAGVKWVRIFADNDESFVGQRSAYILKARLERDYRVDILIAPVSGWDWNDELMSRQVKSPKAA